MRDLQVCTSAGIPFTIVYLAAGESGHFPAARSDKHAMVEFYDARHPGTPFGQFVVRYWASTLLDDVDDTKGLALSLHEPDWSIDAQTMRIVRDWITHEDPAQDETPPTGAPADPTVSDTGGAREARAPLAQLRGVDEHTWLAVMANTNTSRPHEAVLAQALSAALLGNGQLAGQILTDGPFRDDGWPDLSRPAWTVVGFWLDDEIVVTGVIRGVHAVDEGDVTSISDQGCWTGQFTASSAEDAQAQATTRIGTPGEA